MAMTDDDSSHAPRRAKPARHMAGSTTSIAPGTDQDAVTERWLRRSGLPYFVRPARRAHNLVGRITPFIVYLVALDLSIIGLGAMGTVSINVDDSLIASIIVVIVVLAFLLIVALPLVVSLFAVWLLDRFPRARTATAVAVTVVFVAVMPWATELSFLWGDRLWGVVVNAGIVLAALALTLSGIGSLLGWSAVTAVRLLGALGQMTSIALPLLMLVVVFAFFARALWEVTSSMSWPRLGAVAAFFAFLVLLFITPATRRQMSRLLDTLAPDTRAELLERSGLQHLRPSPAATPELTPGERGNITVVMVLAQAFQVAIFAAVVCFFLIVLGQLAFSTAVLTSWLREPPPTISLFGFTLPFDVALIKTAVFLSCISSLNFAVSASTNASYKTAFYDPLFDEARIALAVRDAYRGADSK